MSREVVQPPCPHAGDLGDLFLGGAVALGYVGHGALDFGGGALVYVDLGQLFELVSVAAVLLAPAVDEVCGDLAVQ